ncbi:MAG TPA: ABC transporter ATP-binding protein [Chloroflexota bacterium]|nr:ABC transporter ATP-binding protein [Chloroflexota bacterium]
MSILYTTLRRWAASPRWVAAVEVTRLSPGLTLALALLTVLSALVPAALSLTMGALVAALSGAPPARLAGPLAARLPLPPPPAPAAPEVWLPLAVLGLLFVAYQVLAPLRGAVGDALGRRYKGQVQRRLMRATLHPPTVRHLEDPHLHDRVRQADSEGQMDVGGFPPRMAMLTAERLRGALALLLVAHFSPWLALLLAGAWLVHLGMLRGVHRALIAVRWRLTEALRFGEYLGGLPLRADVAKEVRVFGLAGWLGGRFEATWTAALDELWAGRGVGGGAGAAPPETGPRLSEWGDADPAEETSRRAGRGAGGGESSRLVGRAGLGRKTALAQVPVLAAQVLALGWLGWAAVGGEIGVAALVVYATSVLQSEALGAVSDSELAVEYATSRLRPLAALEREVAQSPALALPGAAPAAGLPREGLSFQEVTFRYPERAAPALRGLTLEIPAGRSLAIVGANGAGKTTLVKLLCRLYDPDGGQILVDGTDLRRIDPLAWQRRVAPVFQDFVQYQLPAYDNVALGAVERLGQRALVEEAARRAGALDLIRALPGGWETVLSRRFGGGVELSGGQWQRVALARALFAAAGGAAVLVLDEPTAHLDVRAEAAFYDAFLDLTRGLTTIVISHRFSTVRRADRIVVLEPEGVLESGSHDELLRRGGRYAHLFALQAQRFVEGEREPGAGAAAGAGGAAGAAAPGGSGGGR